LVLVRRGGESDGMPFLLSMGIRGVTKKNGERKGVYVSGEG